VSICSRHFRSHVELPAATERKDPSKVRATLSSTIGFGIMVQMGFEEKAEERSGPVGHFMHSAPPKRR